ncbi:reverse transcriptase [Lasius niger]|uniref:Reverse transcriptase n=1 Tax=Lasius niger TaxID=67767 RepID=A0A0J7NKG1_LASNI|nr:reverse transcriptase [Lasius niger]
MEIRILQVNINRSRRALDLLMHQAKELGAGLLLISVPCNIPPAENWYVSQDKSSAIYVDANFNSLRCRLAKQGDKSIAIYCGPYLVVSTYISPNLGLREYDNFLNELSGILSSRVDKVIVAGDFNAKASLWGANITNGRELQVTKWAAEQDLRIVNTGIIPTCVHPQGSLIIDLTWSSPDLLPLISNWHVKEELETLSDHVCICFDVCTGRPRPPPTRTKDRRWNLKKFDRDLFKAALIWGSRNPEVDEVQDLNQSLKELDKLMEEACDAAALRIGPRKPRKKAYWWQESVANLRLLCIRARRLWQRAKRRMRSLVIVNDLGDKYKTARKNLRLEINRLKAKAWQELIETIDRDPWGLPYKLVLGKLRPATPGLSEQLDHDVLSRLLDSLIPRNNLPDPIRDRSDFVWSDNRLVSVEEVINALKKGPLSMTKAPGPDGFRLIIWKRTPEIITRWITHIFNVCLKREEFPCPWKCANLILIPKANNQGTGPLTQDIPKARPICLLNELGKTFERVLSERIQQWQISNPESDVSKYQFGFRKNKSTCDALLTVRGITSTAVKNGGLAFVVSLDIANAFNSIPWRVIRRALRRKGYPLYIRRILDSYFVDRTIRYLDRDGNWNVRNMKAGVPQGSVLGPVLWNIAFDEILDLAEEDERSHILCYADDTLIVVTGRDLRTTQLRASLLVARIIISI